jgi:multidrug efflux system outer membrane protein
MKQQTSFSARHPLQAAAAAFALALAAGCSSLASRYERPAAPVAERFPLADAATASGITTAAADLPWQQFFADARLRALVELALANNRDLRVAVLNVDAARALVTVRRADELPTVGVGATGLRQPGSGGGMSSVYTAGLSFASWEIDLFGRIRSLGEAAGAQYLASDEGRKAAQIALVSTVAGLHYAIAADDELLALTERTLATRDESLRLTKLRFDNGASSELDLRLAQSQVEAARIARAAQRRQRELDYNALVLLVGQALPASLPPGQPWNAQALADVPAGLPSEVLLRRPDVLQAEQQLIAANANIGAARAAFYPRITLTASVGTASTHLADLFKDSAWSYAPQIFLPLFDRGRNRANLEIAEAQRGIAVAQYERAIQSAFRDVADALAGRATLAEQLQAQQAQTDAETARFNLSQLRFDNGIASSLELLDAQRTLFAAQQALITAQLALQQNRIASYRALGGGWIEAAPPAR